MVEKCLLRRRARTLAAAAVAHRTTLALGLALALAACTVPSARMSEDVATAGAFVTTAVGDAEEVARRARKYHSANVRERAAIEVEEAEVILRKARDARDRIREAHRAAVAELAELRAKTAQAERDAEGYETSFNPDFTAEFIAVGRVDRITKVLAKSNGNVSCGHSWWGVPPAPGILTGVGLYLGSEVHLPAEHERHRELIRGKAVRGDLRSATEPSLKVAQESHSRAHTA